MRTARRVMVVDDHPLVRFGIMQLIENADGLTVCGEADSVAQARKKVAELQPDLVVLDISLKDGSGLDLVKHVRAEHPEVRILVSSMHDESLYAERAVRAGAMGYVHKEAAGETVLEAIQQVLDGEVYLSPNMVHRVLGNLARGKVPDKGGVQSLSDRELEVFEQIGHGQTTRQIAQRLHLSAKTIETYRENIKGKLHLRTAGELHQYAVQWVLEHC